MAALVPVATVLVLGVFCAEITVSLRVLREEVSLTGRELSLRRIISSVTYAAFRSVKS